MNETDPGTLLKQRIVWACYASLPFVLATIASGVHFLLNTMGMRLEAATEVKVGLGIGIALIATTVLSLLFWIPVWVLKAKHKLA